jgi:hypothetical protein
MIDAVYLSAIAWGFLLMLAGLAVAVEVAVKLDKRLARHQLARRPEQVDGKKKFHAGAAPTSSWPPNSYWTPPGF